MKKIGKKIKYFHHTVWLVHFTIRGGGGADGEASGSVVKLCNSRAVTTTKKNHAIYMSTVQRTSIEYIW